jgi:glutathione S-transferase
MIRVFHSPRSRSVRVLWMAEELGVPYEIEPVSFGEPRSEAFLAANPAGTLPAMVDGEATITESVAILQYLGDRYGPTDLIVKPGEPAYPDYLQFLILGEAGLGAPLNAVIGTKFFGPDAVQGNWTVNMVIEGFLRRMKLVDQQLESHAFMAGDRFTAADISVGYVVGLGAHFLGFADRMSPQALDYHRRLTERPAFQRASAR